MCVMHRFDPSTRSRDLFAVITHFQTILATVLYQQQPQLPVCFIKHTKAQAKGN